MSEAMSERELEEMAEEALEIEDAYFLEWLEENGRKLAVGLNDTLSEVRRSHTEAAEAKLLRAQVQSLKTLNSDLTKARDRAVARLREEERNRAWERTRAEELVMCKSRELAELRERIESLEGVLDKVSNCAPTYPETGRFYLVPEYLFKEVRAALSQANAPVKAPRDKLETRSEEGRKSERT